MSTTENTTGRPALSLVIITYNAATQLAQCIESAGFADEVLVVDSGSSDGTPEIALEMGASVKHQPWLGFGLQKQYAVAQASYDWVLCLDADEYLSPALAREMQTVLNQPTHFAYAMPRRNFFLGRWLKHGEGYPDWNVRLFNRRYANWSSDAVHEKVHCAKGHGRLRHEILHMSEQGLAGYLEKQNKYTSMQAKVLFEAGGRANVGHLIFSPVSRFIKFYVLRLGFLDGIAGLIHIMTGCWSSFIKYAKLIAYQKEKVK